MRPLTIILLVYSLGLSGQQLPQYSQYMLNELAINPAVSGRDRISEVRSNSRQQWIGIPDAPRTFILGLQGPIKNEHMGVGVNIFTDIVGPTRRTGIQFSYAYHARLSEKYYLGMGLSAGALQWGIDGNKITLREEGDQQLLTTYQTTTVPDLGAGLYFYQKDVFYVGLSFPQMYRAPLNLYTGAVQGSSKLAGQINFNGAYKYAIDEDFSLEPSFLVKYEKPAPVKIDVGLRAIYRKEIWLGAVYRHMDAVSALIGYLFKDYLMIGYSYDFGTTRLKKYNSGTHEIMLGLKFTRKQAATWEAKK